MHEASMNACSLYPPPSSRSVESVQPQPACPDPQAAEPATITESAGNPLQTPRERRILAVFYSSQLREI
eukprot:568272-Pleurochrysis_carterae.AAC.3